MTPSPPPYHEPDQRPCAQAGCPKEGLFRAPRSVAAPRDFLWFCLEHVREYNAKWNYLEGRSNSEVECEIRRAALWERPTWPFGKGPLSQKAPHKQPTQAQSELLPNSVQHALATLELAPPTSMHMIKVRYRKLAKSFHPDTSDGSAANIEKFHALQQAFATLRHYYAKKGKTKTNPEEQHES